MPHNIKQKNPIFSQFKKKILIKIISPSYQYKWLYKECHYNSWKSKQKTRKKKKGKGTYYNLESEVLEWIKREVREVILVIWS